LIEIGTWEPQITILLISTSPVVRITGLSHHAWCINFIIIIIISSSSSSSTEG
jgi:hypothetical protein